VVDFGDFIRSHARLGGARRRLKMALLASARIEPGRLTAELRRLPGRHPASTDPDDYDLVVEYTN